MVSLFFYSILFFVCLIFMCLYFVVTQYLVCVRANEPQAHRPPYVIQSSRTLTKIHFCFLLCWRKKNLHKNKISLTRKDSVVSSNEMRNTRTERDNAQYSELHQYIESGNSRTSRKELQNMIQLQRHSTFAPLIIVIRVGVCGCCCWPKPFHTIQWVNECDCTLCSWNLREFFS